MEPVFKKYTISRVALGGLTDEFGGKIRTWIRV